MRCQRRAYEKPLLTMLEWYTYNQSVTRTDKSAKPHFFA
jgi:hypothetical protein